MEDWKLDRIGAAERGENPMVLARLKSGFAVIGDTQFLPGYCVLLAYPKVNRLNELSFTERNDYLSDMNLLGEAIEDVCQPMRMNYSIYGNTDAYLHAHLFPRYEWEEEERKPYPVWLYPKDSWTKASFQYTEERDGDLRSRLTKKINELKEKYYSMPMSK